MSRVKDVPRITISYRRDDSMDITGRIFDRLVAQFGREGVFRDIDNIPPGADFRRHIEQVFDESDVILAIVGPKWAGPRGTQNRLASPADPVRIEIESALRKAKPLIPVLVLRARMPAAEQLPESLRDFAYRSAEQIDSGRDFDAHAKRLIRTIERILKIDQECGHSDVVQGFTAAIDASPTIDAAAVPTAVAHLQLPDRPSIAVLPFANMSSEPDQEFLADGIAEDVITALSRYPSLFVIARNSSFTYKGRPVEVRQVGRELGVRYVLGGSLRKFGNRIRVSAQLVEAGSGNHVWAERYDRDLADLFAVQDEIAEAVTTAIAPAIANAERQRAMRKPPGNLDAWAAYQRGLWHLGTANAEETAMAIDFFQRAINLDPNFAGGYCGLATTQLRSAIGFATQDLSEMSHSAEILARRAVALDDADAEVRACLSRVLWIRGDYVGAQAEAEQALFISPNLASAHAELGAALIFSGRRADGAATLEKSIRLDPRDPRSATRVHVMAIGAYLSGNYDAALRTFERAIHLYPDYPLSYRWRAATLGQLGRPEEAREALDKAVAIAPATFETLVRNRAPFVRPDDYAHMLEGLRKAGWEP